MKGSILITAAMAAMGAQMGDLMPRGKRSRIVGHYDPEKDKVDTGRNEPCPCGSGKKYKKCCTKKY